MTYFVTTPEHTRFLLETVGELSKTLELPAHQRTTMDLSFAILEEAEKFATNILAPLNVKGDKQGSQRNDNGSVKTPDGFADAYQKFTEMGWNSATVSGDLGGQGLPYTLNVALQELWQGANMAFALCPLLTQGAIELLNHYGDDEQKLDYLPWIVSGQWTATMCMTEPQAGSDVGAIRTSATANGDHYLIKGSKIYITYGEHDMAENILHLVLARLPDAPAGAKGISLFIVPKFMLNRDGSLGARNDVVCASLEHKLGIHGSPTATIVFGEKTGAIGYLVGEPHQGLRAMFTMMNSARLAVGIQGIAQGAQALAHAKYFAAERVQGKAVGQTTPCSIDKHPDIRRVLLNSQAQIDGLRGLAFYIGRQMDIAHAHTDERTRKNATALVDLLIPVIKAHGTDSGIHVVNQCLQVFGGMGFVEETGIAQRLRDVRITAIYEGTNGIQANDLITRKVLLQEGGVLHAFFAEIMECCSAVHDAPHHVLKAPSIAIQEAVRQLDLVSLWVRKMHDKSAHDDSVLNSLLFHAAHYMELFGLVCQGYMLLHAAHSGLQKLDSYSQSFVEERIKMVVYFSRYLLPKAMMLSQMIISEQE